MSSDRPLDVLVVGAGLAGLACARSLHEAGCRVRILEKSRGRGGRCATRRFDGAQFDTGAQYLSPGDSAFHALLAGALSTGQAAEWTGPVGGIRPQKGQSGDSRPRLSTKVRYVGVPGMSALAALPGEGLEVLTEHRVVGFEREEARWQVHLANGLRCERASWVIVAAPAPQAAQLLREAHAAWSQVLGRVRMDPCLACLLRFAEPLPFPAAASFFDSGDLVWAARDSSKPGRPPGECWVLHSARTFAREHVDAPEEVYTALLMDALSRRLDGPLPAPELVLGHRWRYAFVREPLGDAFLIDPALRLGACGDWGGRSRIDLAYESGRALAEAVLAAR